MRFILLCILVGVLPLAVYPYLPNAFEPVKIGFLILMAGVLALLQR
jgi:hypothetical protein